MKSIHDFEFHSFRVLPAQRILLCEGHRVRITGKAFDLLLVLIEKRHEVVSREELLTRVWPGVNVDASSVRVTVGRLRLALRDTAQEIIVTVTSQGYRFVAPVKVIATDRKFASESPAFEGVTAPPTPDIHALQCYLKGRQLIDTRTSQGLRFGSHYFKKAIALDANFAAAWAGLADAYLLRGNFQLLAPEKAYKSAAEAVDKALNLNPNCAEAYAAQAGVIAAVNRDLGAAQSSLHQSLKYNPAYAVAHHRLGLLSIFTGNHQNAAAHLRQAQWLQPLSLIINTDVGWGMYLSGNFAAAEEQLQATIELGGNCDKSYYLLARCLMLMGKPEKALSVIRRVMRHDNDPFVYSTHGHLAALLGERDEAQASLTALKKAAQRFDVMPCFQGAIYLGMGDYNRAVEFFGQSKTSYQFIFEKTDPMFRQYKYISGFQQILG